MNELLKARLKTFFVLALVMELIVLGMAFWYRSMMTATFDAKIAEVSGDVMTQAKVNVQNALRKIENVTQQMLLDPRLRKEIEAVQLGSWDGITEKKAITNIRNQLTALMYINPNIATIRLFPKDNVELAGADITKLLSNMPLMPINYSDMTKQSLQDMAKANGDYVWVPTLKNGLFFPPELEKTKDFPGYTMSVGRLLKNPSAPKSEMIAVIEVQSKLLNEGLENLQIGQNGAWFVTDGNNQIVAAADPALIGQPSSFPALAPDLKEGNVFADETTRVMAGKIEGVPWTIQLAYSPADFSGYLQTVFVMIVTVISVLVLVISLALAWIMNRPYEEEYEGQYA